MSQARPRLRLVHVLLTTALMTLGVIGAPPALADPSDADLVVSVPTIAPHVGTVGDPAIAGTNETVTVRVDNDGPSDNVGYTVSVDLSDGVTFVSSGSDGRCSFNSVDSRVDCVSSGLTVAADHETFDVIVHIPPGFTDGGTFASAAHITTAANNPPAGDSAPISIKIARAADLVTSISALSPHAGTAGDPAIAGTNETVTVRIDNDGPSDNGGYTVSVDLSDGVTFVPSGSDGRCTFNFGQSRVDCVSTGLSLAADHETFAVILHIPPGFTDGGTFTSSAHITSNSTTDPGPGVNSAAITLLVIRRNADLVVTVPSIAPHAGTVGDPAIAGTDETITVRVDNSGPSDNAGYTVSVDLSAGVTFVSTGSDGRCLLGTSQVDCISSGLTLAADHETFAVKVHIPPGFTDGGTFTSSAHITANATADPGPGANSAPISLKVKRLADLKVNTKTFTTPQNPLYANSDPDENTITFTITLENAGPSDAASVSLTDVLPSEFTAGAYCIGAGCTPGGTFSSPLSLPTLTPTGATESVTIQAHAKDTLRGGPKTTTNTASVASATTEDPTPSNNSKTSSTITIATVPDTPENPRARPGNGNAFFRWDTVDEDHDGGSDVDKYVVTVTPVSPAGSSFTVLVDPTDACGTSPNTYQCVIVGGLTNLTTYEFKVQARNAVGLSDATAPEPARPTIDASAKQINAANLSQQTGNSSVPSATDKQISFQIFASGTTGVGTLLETTDVSSTFCGGPCNGQVLKSKLNDPNAPTIGVYQLQLLFHRTVFGSTPVSRITVYYSASDSDPTADLVLPACPKKMPPTPAQVPCAQVKLGSAGANPALKVVIWTDDPDPTSGIKGR